MYIQCNELLWYVVEWQWMDWEYVAGVYVFDDDEDTALKMVITNHEGGVALMEKVCGIWHVLCINPYPANVENRVSS
jgi:hypothetical protein